MRTLARPLLLMLLPWVGAAEAPDMAIPKELKEFEWFIGTWEGTLKMYQPGSTLHIEVKATIKATMDVGGHFIRAEHAHEVPGVGKVQGLEMTTFDAASKQWITLWFEQMSSVPMPFVGMREGDKTVATSKDYAAMVMEQADIQA